MALYFREMTGVDPITVDQTRLSERSEPGYEHPVYRACAEASLLDAGPVILLDAAGTPWSPVDFAVDLQVLTPRTTYRHERPEWMDLGGRRQAVPVQVPEAQERWCLVEARAAEEPAGAVALDRCEIEGSRRAWLYLPPEGAVDLEVFAADGTLLRTISPR